MLLEEWLLRHGKIAHTSEIYAAGFSKHAVTVAVGKGGALRVRRSWIALPDCDADLVIAIAAGGRLTCVSQARRLGLWVPQDDNDVHMVAPAGSGTIRAENVRVHWSEGPAPTRLRAPDDPLLNVLHHAARCLQIPAALALWESALNKKLIAGEVLGRIAWGGRRERRLARAASNLSDSGLETEFVSVMASIGVAGRQQVWLDGHPVDFLIGDRLVVQLDGFAHHSSPATRRRDIEADARLRLRGYTVLRFDYHQIFFQPELVQNMVRTAIAQGLHLAA